MAGSAAQEVVHPVHTELTVEARWPLFLTAEGRQGPSLDMSDGIANTLGHFWRALGPETQAVPAGQCVVRKPQLGCTTCKSIRLTLSGVSEI